MVVMRSKIVAGNHRDMIAGKVDAVNAGDEFTKSQELL